MEVNYINNDEDNNNVTVIPIVISPLGRIPKGFVKRLEELEIIARAETTHSTALLKSARIQKRDVETFCHSDSYCY